MEAINYQLSAEKITENGRWQTRKIQTVASLGMKTLAALSL
jgi:hypothetical protein